jgi:hypothetical protein
VQYTKLYKSLGWVLFSGGRGVLRDGLRLIVNLPDGALVVVLLLTVVFLCVADRDVCLLLDFGLLFSWGGIGWLFNCVCLLFISFN